MNRYLNSYLYQFLPPYFTPTPSCFRFGSLYLYLYVFVYVYPYLYLHPCLCLDLHLYFSISPSISLSPSLPLPPTLFSTSTSIFYSILMPIILHPHPYLPCRLHLICYTALAAARLIAMSDAPVQLSKRLRNLTFSSPPLSCRIAGDGQASIIGARQRQNQVSQRV